MSDYILIFSLPIAVFAYVILQILDGLGYFGFCPECTALGRECKKCWEARQF